MSGVVNWNMTWFGLLEERIADMSGVASGKVAVKTYEGSIAGERAWEEGHIYTRADPVAHFKEKHPDSDWWQE